MRPSPASAVLPPVSRDRNELVECRVELLFATPFEASPQDRDDLALRPSVDEDDEAEAEALLVLAVQPLELRERSRIVLGALFRRGARRRRPCADRRMGVQRLELLGFGELVDHVAGRLERMLP